MQHQKGSTSELLKTLNINSSQQENVQMQNPTSQTEYKNTQNPSSSVTAQTTSSVNEEKKDVFNYAYMNDFFEANTDYNAKIKHGAYEAQVIATNKYFIGLYQAESVGTPTTEGKLLKAFGLKFHVSLPENNKEKFSAGWDIVKNILIANNVRSFKIIRSNFKMSDDPDQAGKDVTIYSNMNPEKDASQWASILQEITAKLTAANIPPGYKSQGSQKHLEKAIEGSNYITYRYHDELGILTKQPKLKFLSIKQRDDFWPKNDLISKIKINVNNQSLPQEAPKKITQPKDLPKEISVSPNRTTKDMV
jgi:hypothetical protein